MQSTITRFITILISSILILGTNASIAQTASLKVDDETLSRFVAAYTDVQKIHGDYAERLQKTNDAEATSDLQQEAEGKMQEAVTRNNITLDEYRSIARQVEKDATLRSRIQAELEDQNGQ